MTHVGLAPPEKTRVPVPALNVPPVKSALPATVKVLELSEMVLV